MGSPGLFFAGRQARVSGRMVLEDGELGSSG
jgi:hypothetical protein